MMVAPKKYTDELREPPLIADAKVLPDLAHDGDGDLGDHCFARPTGAQDRQSVDRDPVRLDPGALLIALSQRNVVVGSEQHRPPAGDPSSAWRRCTWPQPICGNARERGFDELPNSSAPISNVRIAAPPSRQGVRVSRS